MKRIYVVMVADLFHYGHVEFLRCAREFGDYLIVGLTSDESSEKRKRRPILSWEERKRAVEACKYVDEVWLHKGPMCNEFMERHELHLRVFAHKDEKEEKMRVERYRKVGLDPKYYRAIQYTQTISTSKILERIWEREASKPSD